MEYVTVWADGRISEHYDKIADKFYHDADVKARMVDNGIGDYEFWGHCGRDVRMEPELEWNPVTLRVRVVGNPDKGAIVKELQEYTEKKYSDEAGVYISPAFSLVRWEDDEAVFDVVWEFC